MLLSGLLYSKNVEDITVLKHSKKYVAQSKNPTSRSMFGYTVIKLNEDVTFHVGWRKDDLKEYKALKGEYLAQTIMQPPTVIKSWDELRRSFKVFRNEKPTDGNQ
ncbi:hypothetical protein AQ616_18450 [Oceanobacillus sp. E9]|uniref:hypothetical protein n=1 Tax=Oceanobacillus sp. E9 TaxID=1742575 RepID=UPI00084E9205|nr:hypothetical protein [Oceanobacillus sp. E9]OEH53019.1 hypothetical protein AQ616_18450 [Oceanobacillus sp. E9]